MRMIDKSAVEYGGIPSIVLMENAAIACVNEALKHDCVKSAVIFCGKGNNGGDGFAVARHLHNKGIKVSVYLVCGSDFSGDALINYEIISRMGVRIVELNDTDLLNLYISNADITIDAIFGTGIHGEITGLAAEVIEEINKNSRFTLSVDIPSGISADTGEICGICVNADVTVTFAAYKTGLLMFPGADFAGRIVTADISIPEYIIDNMNINVNISDRRLVNKLLPVRRKNTHKGDYGKILIIGGSAGMTGACTMAANAALRSGAGLVTAAVCDKLNPIFEEKLTEPMTLPLPSSDGHLDRSCISKLINVINSYDVCLFGPGLGRSDDICDILAALLKASGIPMIIDADGLYALAKKPSMLEECGCSLILTPHEQEASRLFGCSLDYISADRLGTSMSYATQNSVTLILKGAHTIVTSPAGEQYININGNNGMACGGSGDVLAGMTAAFAAQCPDETSAAVLAVYLHAAAGDLAAEKYGEASLTPTDMLDCIGNALTDLKNG